MTEAEPSTYDFDSEEMGIDAKRARAAGRGREDARLPIDDPRRGKNDTVESSLKEAVARIVKEALSETKRSNMGEAAMTQIKNTIATVVKEMKLGIASRMNFDPSQLDDPEDDFVTNFLLAKKDKDAEAKKKAPDDKKSGTKLKTTRKRSKSSQFR